jgi:hypothetical protein
VPLRTQTICDNEVELPCGTDVPAIWNSKISREMKEVSARAEPMTAGAVTGP